MNKKNQKYIILMVTMMLLLFITAIGGAVFQTLKNKSQSIDMLLSAFIIQFVVYCFSGMIFGLENFINEREKVGYWKVNLSKLMILGIPSLIIGFFNVLFYVFGNIPSIISGNLITYNLFINFMQMLFGYSILTSFIKCERN
jgi:hypothetical protein